MKKRLLPLSLVLILLLSALLFTGCDSLKSSLFAKEESKSNESDEIQETAVHRYEFVISDCSWAEAQQMAKACGGYLVNFNSMEEYTSVLAEIEAQGYKDVYFRIGGRRSEDSKEYYWANAEGELYGECLNKKGVWCYALWLGGEPNFEWESHSEEFIEIYYSDEEKSWVWNDVGDQMTYPKDPEKCGYIIEYDVS